MSNPLDNPLSVFEGTSKAQVSITAPGAAKRNFLTSLVVKSDAACVLTIQSPAATNILEIPLQAGEGFAMTFLRGKRGAVNQALVIDVSAGNYDINFDGVVTQDGLD